MSYHNSVSYTSVIGKFWQDRDCLTLCLQSNIYKIYKLFKRSIEFLLNVFVANAYFFFPLVLAVVTMDSAAYAWPNAHEVISAGVVQRRYVVAHLGLRLWVILTQS